MGKYESYSGLCPINTEPHGTVDLSTGEVKMYGNLSDIKKPKPEYVEQDDGRHTVIYRMEADHE